MTIKISVRSRKGYMDPNKIFALKDMDLNGENFSGKNLISFTIVNSRFNHCQFENLKVDSMCFGAGLTQSTYVDCSFDRSNLTGSVLGNARFIRCTFRDITLYHFLSFKGEFIDCIFSGKIQGTVFYGSISESDQKNLSVKRSSNEFYGNDFTGVEFLDIGFRKGVDLSLQKLPMSDKYIYISDGVDCLLQLKKELVGIDMEEIYKKARKKKSTTDLTEEEKLNFELGIWIKSFTRDIEGGQKQFFLVANELTSEVSVLNKMIEIFRNIAVKQQEEMKKR